MASAATSQQRPVDVEMTKFQTLQAEIQELVNQQQQYNQQANENGMVQEELKLAKDSSKVYKLVGPVLLPQDIEDAKSNVQKRLEFIKNESEKVGKILTRKQTEATELREKIGQMQAAMKTDAVAAANAAGASAMAASS